MALLSVIRRWHFREHLSIREIGRRTGLSRNTIRKYLRVDGVEPKFNVPERPSKLDPFADRLSAWLRTEAKKSRKQKRTMKQLHADLVSLGYEGSYNRVAAFAREWKADLQRELQTTGRGTFVPLAFDPGEAFKFDWSEDWAIIGTQVINALRGHLAEFGIIVAQGPANLNASREFWLMRRSICQTAFEISSVFIWSISGCLPQRSMNWASNFARPRRLMRRCVGSAPFLALAP